jgi:hypothetical protein
MILLISATQVAKIIGLSHSSQPDHIFLESKKSKECTWKLLEQTDKFVVLIVVMVSWVSKLIKLYTLNLYSLLHVNYTSINWLL